MKIVLIAKQNIEKTYSGATRTVYEQIKYFKGLGHEVHVVGELINKKDLEKSGAIAHKTHRWFWQKKFKRRLQFSKAAQALAKNLSADLVIGHGDLQYQDIFLLHNSVHLAEEKINGKKLDSSTEMYQIHTPILKNQQFKKIIANSEIMKNDLIARFDIPESKISVIYPAVDTESFKNFSLEKKHALKKSFNFSEDEYLVGLVTSGNFKKRGVDRFFKAIDLLDEKLALKTNFILVGKDKLSPYMQELLDKNKYKSRIHILPVISNVDDYFNALDIFVLPARIEEFGRVVAEAMSCGCPVITTKWVGASELLDSESKEFVFEGEDVSEFASLMSRLLDDSKLKQTIGELNSKSVIKGSEQEMFKKFDIVFSEFLES